MVGLVPVNGSTYREETSLEQSQDHTASGKCVPIVCETHSDHDCSPRNTEACEEVARTNLASKDGCWGLEDDVRDEENKGHRGLVFRCRR